MEDYAMERYYFTFGYDHKYSGHYVVIEGTDYDDARDRMFGLFGKEWAFQYTEEMWKENERLAKESGRKIETELTDFNPCVSTSCQSNFDREEEFYC